MDPEEPCRSSTHERQRCHGGGSNVPLYERKKADAEAAETTRLREFNEEHGKIHVVHRYRFASGNPLQAILGLRVCACVQTRSWPL